VTDKRVQAKLVVLNRLYCGAIAYNDVQADFEQAAGLAGTQATAAFARLVWEMIAGKLIDYSPEPGATGDQPRIATLRLRPRGEAWIAEHRTEDQQR
jgi:hypothetical protein